MMICVVFAAALVLTFVVSQTLLMKRFAELEKQNTSQNTERAVSALYKDFDSVSVTFSEATADPNNFSMVMDENGMHMKINIGEPAFQSLGLNYILFVMPLGLPPAGLGFDLETGQPIPFVPGLMEELTGDGPLAVPPQVDSTAVTGILVLPENTLLVQAYPYAVESAMLPGGSIVGRLIFARFLDAGEVDRLAEQTHLSLGLYRLDDPQMPADFVAAQSRLSDEASVITQPLSKDTVAGYGLLKDIYGNPAMIMRADMPRDIYHQGQQTVYWLIAYLTAAFVAFALVVIILMNRVILSRLLGLSKGVDRVRKTGDLTERVAVQGKDELSKLGGAINGMLGSLEEKEGEKQALLNAIPDLMFRVGEDGTILDARATEGGVPAVTEGGATDGKAYQESLQYKALSAEVIHRGLPLVRQALQTRETQVFEIQVPLNGDTAYYEARVAASSKNEALVMVRDITEKKHEEEARRRGLLLKEIHHRVKNNLQVVSSLLYLQSTRVSDKNVIEMFKESSNRVQSMSLIHQKLYQSKDAESIDFAGYVHDLTGTLLRSYGVDQSAVKVMLNVDGAGLCMDSALPCGLIINELVSNSLKHAFPRGRAGEVRIIVTRDEGDRIKLVVADNGVGIPGDLDLQNAESLGLQLVVNLVDQLRGTITLNREAGMEFTIAFREARGVSPIDRQQGEYEYSVTPPGGGGNGNGIGPNSGS
jgi:two-component sensor histidine kinase/sensor domain CHASE-containing protein